MDSFNLPNSDDIEKIVALILGLPGRMLDSALIFVNSAGYAQTSPLVKLICIFILAAGGLLLCYRARRYFIAWFVGLYALLILIVSGSQLILSVIAIISPPEVLAKGQIEVFRTKVTEGQENLPGDWSSNDCGYSQVADVRRCSADGNQLGSKFQLTISSANCGSAVENIRLDPSSPACLIVTERRQGCGNENILGIRNCKGRGWLKYVVTASTSKNDLVSLGIQPIDATFTAAKPLVVALAQKIGADTKGVALKFTITLKNARGESVTITDQNPSTDRFSAQMVGSDLIISQGAESQQPATLN